jgi:gamma-glutamyltranspeptidase/glutathione hydrolase
LPALPSCTRAAAAAGAMIFQQGGNAIDAACAMLAAVSTLWDVLG